MINKITNLKRVQQQAIMPPFKGQPQRQGQSWRPKPPNEQRVPKTLDPANVIDQEETPWCLPCGDSYWEHKCPRNNGGPFHINFLDTINSIFVMSHQECLNITLEQLKEGKKEVVKRARMEIIIKMDNESREKLRKREL
jgi:hypothetical protein